MLTILSLLATIPDPGADPGGFIAFLASLWGQWWLFGAVAAIGLTWALRKFGAQFIPWFGTRVGGVVLAVVTAAASTLAAALLDGAAVSWALIGQALIAGVTAIGAHSATKNLKQGNG